jgi:hypothetical protein
MKTIYIRDLNATIANATAALTKAQQALTPVKKELKVWRPGTTTHTENLTIKAKLDSKIAGLKKRIADAQRLKKTKEVLRRDAIRMDVESIAQFDMDLYKADSVLCYVNDAPGGVVKAETENAKNWTYYAKSFKYPKIEHDIRMTVNPDWDKSVQDRDLAFLGGMLTLSAKTAHKVRNRNALELADRYNIDLYEAVWMRKGRGFQVSTESGFIAIKRTSLGAIPATAYHGASALKAVEGCHRKFQNIDDLPLEIRDVPADAVATWADAKAVGACDVGVKAWCDAADIDHTAASVPLVDVVRGYYKKPAPEAKAIILRVLRGYPRKGHQQAA